MIGARLREAPGLLGRCDMLGKTFKQLLLAAGILLMRTAPAFCQPANEGFDPMLQITHQFAHPNLLLVLDVSGSMEWDMPGCSDCNIDVDDVGAYPSWVRNRPSSKASSNPCSGQYRHTCTLTAGKAASRMAIIKNALGNSVTLYDWNKDSIPSSTWAAMTVNTGWVYNGVDSKNQPIWYYCRNSSTSPSTYPFTVTESTPGVVSHPPMDLIGQTSSSVNWAVVTFSTDYADCSKATVNTTFDLTESGDITAIENLFKLKSAGGLDVGGSTPTKGAMTFAKTFLKTTATGGTIVDYDKPNVNDKNSWTVDRDDKFFSCNRTYGVVLVTDGLSNSCNADGSNAGKNWINPCGVAPYKCDASGGSYDCDRRSNNNRSYAKFPPGAINDLYLTTVTDGGQTYRMDAKTWVIGVSNSASPCELNYNAYMGRTDASSPLGDAGFKTSGDLDRLPNMNTYTESASDPYPDKLHYTTPKDNEEATSHYNTHDPRTTGQPYAFFADSSDSLADAFASIVAGLGTGDYTTSSPVANPGTSSSGSQVFLTTADFPEWRGHIYCYNSETNPATLMWDAGEILTAQSSASRKIFTWNSSNDLVEINATNLNTLKSIASAYTTGFDTSTMTAAVVDFIRGNNGSGASRSWKLGGIVNSTPTLVMKPESFTQGTVDQSHSDFVTAYGSRKTLLYSGSDDGLLHAFLTEETEVSGVTYPAGTELFALLPPNLLAMQVQLYDNFVTDGVSTGQEKKPKDHIYGLANSPRYGDVYFQSEGKWRTMLYLTEGPGGTMLAAVDITDPFGKLFGGGTPENPVSVLWHHTAQTCPEMKKTWSVPAFASSSSTAFEGVIGSGYDPVNATTSPYMFRFNPVDGTLTARSISAGTSPTPYMRNQAFADSVIFQTNARAYYQDNIADLGLQADLHGRIWFFDRSAGTFNIGINASTKAGNSQPIYYSPAVSGYKKGTATFDLYAFSSGTYYEKDTDITGGNVGKTGYFIPSLYVACTSPWSTGVVPSANITQVKIQDVKYTDDDGNLQSVGKRTQPTSSPLLLIPLKDSLPVLAVFSIYDPDTDDCAGTSYIVKMSVSLSSTGVPTASTSAYSAGSGAVSGFAIVGSDVVVAKSGVGEGAKATISRVPDLKIEAGTGTPTPIWWRELQ